MRGTRPSSRQCWQSYRILPWLRFHLPATESPPGTKARLGLQHAHNHGSENCTTHMGFHWRPVLVGRGGASRHLVVWVEKRSGHAGKPTGHVSSEKRPIRVPALQWMWSAVLLPILSIHRQHALRPPAPSTDCCSQDPEQTMFNASHA